jgi:hypothetical protein
VFGLRVGFYDSTQQLALNRESVRIGRLIPLTAAPAALGCFERRQERSADVGWTAERLAILLR